MRPIAIPGGILCVMLASAACARSVTYEYQGLPFGYGTPWQTCPAPSGDPNVPDPCPTSPWTGSLTIDESAYPERKIAGSTLRLRILNSVNADYIPCDGRGILCYEFEVTTATGGWTYVTTRKGWDSFDFFQYDGHVGKLIDFTYLAGYFSWTFDDEGNVTSWYGSNDCLSYACDPRSYGGIFGRDVDYFGSGATTQGAGTWTRVGGGTGPVPLPPSALGLLSGHGVLVLQYLRRARAATDPVGKA